MTPFAIRFPGLVDACAPGSSPEDRAMVRNLVCEHRVPDGRLNQFASPHESLTDIREFERALTTYYHQHVRPARKDASGKRSIPAYARPENRTNAVRLAPDAMLATVINLTWLGRVYLAAVSDFKMKEFQRFAITKADDYAQINDQLSARVKDEAFLDAIFRALASYRRSRLNDRIRHTWAAEWKSLQPFLDPARPARWLRAAGVHTEHPSWLAVVRYPSHRGRRMRPLPLFRPTQLEAGWYAHHFPSPPQAKLKAGGHTMFLRPQRHPQHDRYGLVSEYVHEQIDFTLDHWHAAGSLIEIAGASGGSIEDQREAHWRLLQSDAHYGPEVRNWMEDFL